MTYSNATEVWNVINNTSDINEVIDILEVAETQTNPIKLNAADLKILAKLQSTNISNVNSTILYSP